MIFAMPRTIRARPGGKRKSRDVDITSTVRIGIRQASELVDRRMGTLRKWEAEEILPDELMPHRDERGWRFWTIEQIEGIREWIKTTHRIPGKALPNYSPTEKSLNKALSQMRRPRVCVICEGAITSKQKYTRLRGRAVHRDCMQED